MKKKSVFLGILFLALIVMLTGCGINSNNDEESSSKEDKASKYTLNMNETKSINDTIEITIKSNKVVNKIEPANASGYYTYYEAGEGYKYLDITADIKNISSDDITMREMGTAKLYIGDEEYEATYMSEEDNGARLNGYANSRTITPLETVTFHIASKVEKSAFEDGFTADLVMNLNKKDYTYTVNVVNSEGDDTNSSTVYLKNKGKEISENELVTIENNCEFTIKSNKFEKKIEPPAATGYYHYLNATDGKVYLNVRATVKNLKSTAVRQDSVLGNITVIYDDSYEYKCSKVVEEDNGEDLNTYTSIYDIDPLASMEYYIVAELPEEVQNSNKPLYVKFSINGEDYVYNIR
mgnify:CR=1 FL=1